MLQSAWRYRYYIRDSIAAEFRGRFARSYLGGLWMLINPLAQVAIFALILSTLLAAKLPGIDNRFAYAIYLSAGILCWSLFADLINGGLNLFITQGNLLKKIAFPRICLPLIATGTALVNHLSLLLAILVLFTLLGYAPSPQLLWLPVPMLIVTALGLGIGLVLGTLNVFLRDIGQVVPIVLQFAFWLTPIVYVDDLLPAWAQPFLALNPIRPVVAAYQDILAFRTTPELAPIIVSLVLAGLSLALALFLFRRADAEMVDLL
jgi:lipopolysaccharide transport system permease protein